MTNQKESQDRDFENGNTDILKSGKKKQGNQCYHWCFTLNNYTTEDIDELYFLFNYICIKWIFGEEVSESGTPHLQGMITLKTKKRLSNMKNYNMKIHWEASRNIIASYKYCEKDGKVHANFTNNFFFDQFRGVIWKPFQLKVLKTVTSLPNDRTVNWIWDDKGNIGKSFLCKYLVGKYNALLVGGKKSDIFHQVAKRCEEEINIGIVLIDIPRCAMSNVSYGAIESLKNGCIFSGKYEGGQYLFASPHVFVFANKPPDLSMMSRDRWNIVEV